MLYVTVEFFYELFTLGSSNNLLTTFKWPPSAALFLSAGLTLGSSNNLLITFKCPKVDALIIV